MFAAEVIARFVVVLICKLYYFSRCEDASSGGEDASNGGDKSNHQFTCSSLRECWKCIQDPCTRRNNGKAPTDCVWCRIPDHRDGGICMSNLESDTCSQNENQTILERNQRCPSVSHRENTTAKLSNFMSIRLESTAA